MTNQSTSSDYLPEDQETFEIALSLPGGRSCAHVFDAPMIYAVNAAIAAGRPLLIRGEPGTGKSQLARATAKKLERAFVSFVLDVHTEPRDLLWWLDSVERLAEAQLMGAIGRDKNVDEVREQLALERYIQPGPLWWAYNWGHAEKQAGKARVESPEQIDDGKPENGCVLLLDEIDKADSSVPNGLLEALGHGLFATPVGKVTMVKQPLVIITTNGERELPEAFLRRCFVLPLALPTEEEKLVTWLVKRGQSHFGEGAKLADGQPRPHPLSLETFELVAMELAKVRVPLVKRELAAPGQAEYLDILRVLDEMTALHNPKDPAAYQEEYLQKVMSYALNKHPRERCGR